MDEQLQALKEQLKPGETLLWSGRPEGFEALDAEYRSAYIVRMIISFVCAAVLSAIYITASLRDETEIKWGIIVIMVAAAAFIALNPFSDVKKLKKNYLYAVTDKRVIIMTDKIKEAPFSAISNAAVRKDAAGTVSFLFGESARVEKARAFRSLAVTCINKDDNDFPKYAVMYGVKDHESLKSILKQYIPLS